jgi:phage head maturation protease
MSDPYWKFAANLPAVRLRSNPDGGQTMFGRFVSDGEWALIRNEREGGPFLEQTSLRAFAVSILEDRDSIRCLFNHGQDPYCGLKPLGVIKRLETTTDYEVDLFHDADYVRGLIPGLRSRQYGASFHARVIRDEIEVKPRRTSWNPNGIPQVRIVEAQLREFGPCLFPAYAGTVATTNVRSSDPPDGQRVGIINDLAPGERWVTRSKPGSPGVIQRERVAEGELASWEREPDPWWLLKDMPRPWRHKRRWWTLA